MESDSGKKEMEEEWGLGVLEESKGDVRIFAALTRFDA